MARSLPRALRVGAEIDAVLLTVRKLEGVDAGVDQQPPQWTLLWFEAADADADRLAEQLSGALEVVGGWYADFHSDSDVIVVFAGRIFRYRRCDERGRAQVAEYARSVGVQKTGLIGLSRTAVAGPTGDGSRTTRHGGSSDHTKR